MNTTNEMELFEDENPRIDAPRRVLLRAPE